jgi:type I restriction enzyme S subunit
MPNWPNKKLGEITTKIGSGSTPRGGEAVYTKTGVPLIRSMNVHFAGLKPDGFVWSNSTRSLRT